MKTQKKIFPKKQNEILILQKTPDEILSAAKQKVKLTQGVYKNDILVEKNGRIYSPYLELLFDVILKTLDETFDKQYFLDNPKEDRIKLLVANNLAQKEKDPALHTLKIITDLKDLMRVSCRSFLFFFDLSDWNGTVYKVFDTFFTQDASFIKEVEKAIIERLSVDKSIISNDNTESNNDLNKKILALQNQSIEDKKTISKLENVVWELMDKVSFLMARDNLAQTFPMSITTVGASTYSNPIYKPQSENNKQEESDVSQSTPVLGSGAT